MLNYLLHVFNTVCDQQILKLDALLSTLRTSARKCYKITMVIRDIRPCLNNHTSFSLESCSPVIEITLCSIQNLTFSCANESVNRIYRTNSNFLACDIGYKYNNYKQSMTKQISVNIWHHSKNLNNKIQNNRRLNLIIILFYLYIM